MSSVGLTLLDDGSADDFVTVPSKALLMAEARVRQELARDLHDTVAQTLTQMLVEMENFKHDQVGRASVLRNLELYQSSTREVLSALRTLLYSLRGQATESADFRREVTELLSDFERGTGIRTRLRFYAGWPEIIPTATALQLSRILTEALSNAGRHSGTGLVEVTLRRASGNHLALMVRDYGRGLPVLPRGLGGMGLAGMRERAINLGGQLQIEPAPGKGTVIRVLIPAPSGAAAPA